MNKNMKTPVRFPIHIKMQFTMKVRNGHVMLLSSSPVTLFGRCVVLIGKGEAEKVCFLFHSLSRYCHHQDFGRWIDADSSRTHFHMNDTTYNTTTLLHNTRWKGDKIREEARVWELPWFLRHFLDRFIVFLLFSLWAPLLHITSFL